MDNAPLNVFADLRVETDIGREILVSADAEVVTVTLPSLWVGRPMLQQLSNRQRRAGLLEHVHGGLKRADLVIEFRIAHRVIALIGPQSRPNLLTRLLGFGPIELKIVPILLSLFKR